MFVNGSVIYITYTPNRNLWFTFSGNYKQKRECTRVGPKAPDLTKKTEKNFRK